MTTGLRRTTALEQRCIKDQLHFKLSQTSKPLYRHGDVAEKHLQRARSACRARSPSGCRGALASAAVLLSLQPVFASPSWVAARGEAGVPDTFEREKGFSSAGSRQRLGMEWGASPGSRSPRDHRWSPRSLLTSLHTVSALEAKFEPRIPARPMIDNQHLAAYQDWSRHVKRNIMWCTACRYAASGVHIGAMLRFLPVIHSR